MTEEVITNLVDRLLPKIRLTIWKASLICSCLVGLMVYLLSRKDVADLRSELNRQVTVQQHQHVTLSEDPVKSLATDILHKQGRL